jgi:NADH pyrophosphatase NudC (nudix superfamily)
MDMSWLYCPACGTAWKAAEGKYCFECNQEGEPDYDRIVEP